eukprot:scaffold74689_cov17-Tisochrysis_lutea.AAC.1
MPPHLRPGERCCMLRMGLAGSATGRTAPAKHALALHQHACYLLKEGDYCNLTQSGLMRQASKRDLPTGPQQHYFSLCTIVRGSCTS